jgi:hypothetical protein
MELVLWYCLVLSEAFLPTPGGTYSAEMPGTAELVQLAEGRLLACRVKWGMTWGQVKQALGEPEGGCFSTGPVWAPTDLYSRRGLCVSVGPDGRVVGVWVRSVRRPGADRE